MDPALGAVVAELLSLRKDLKEFATSMDRAFARAQANEDDRFQALDARLESRFDSLDARLLVTAEDVSKIKLAVVDLLQTDRHLRNLVSELKGHGINLDVAKIFAA